MPLYNKIIAVIFTALISLEASAQETACDTVKGKRVFNKCKICHSIDAGKNMQGPRLYGLMGRSVGSQAGYSYSKAMQEADFLWGEATFKAFIEKPMKYIKGTSMPFGGIRREGQRNDLYCFLSQFK